MSGQHPFVTWLYQTTVLLLLFCIVLSLDGGGVPGRLLLVALLTGCLSVFVGLTVALPRPGGGESAR